MVRPLMVLIFMAVAGAAATDSFDPSEISLPEGFSIGLVTDAVPNARSLAAAGDEVVFVSTRRAGKVYALREDSAGDVEVLTVLEGLTSPNGVAFHNGSLYVAEIKRVLRYADALERLDKLGKPEIVIDDLPSARLHGWRYIGFGPDQRLYVAIGAPCNVCDQPDYALIVSFTADGKDRRVEARGVRNSVGFTWHPETGELWFTDNGRDWLGDDLPPGELNRLTAPGEHFGFPFCHGGDLPDPDFGRPNGCADSVPPVQQLGPHVAPLGVTFYTGDKFPQRYRNQAFIAEHGSWNRSEKIGYRVTLVTLQGGEPVSYAPFAQGWLRDGRVTGRPVDLLVRPNGDLWVSDDGRGAVYRIRYHSTK